MSEITSPIILDETGQAIKDAILRVASAVNDKKGVIYGFHIDSNESDPSACVTYLKDAVGMTPAKMDYSNDVFDYGSWKDAFFMPRPCMVKSNGLVDYYLDEDDFSKKEDGTASDIADASYDGNAMMEWGRDGKKIWYKVVPDKNDPTSGSIYIADHKEDDDFHAYSFVNNQGMLVDHFYTAIYNGSVDSNSKMRSISGVAVSKSLAGTAEMTAARANNADANTRLWDIETFGDGELIYYLLYLMGKSLDLQTVYGQGLSTGGTEVINDAFRTGVHNAKGLFYGTNSGTASTYTNAVKVFGMENFYAFQWRRKNGLILVDNTYKVKLTAGMQDGSTASDYNTTGEGYIECGTAPAQGYQSKNKFFGGLCILPNSITDGASNKYYCDYFYVNASGTRFLLSGGYSAYGASCGRSLHLAHAVSAAGWSFGAALSMKPLLRG